jgi:Ca-activated chloride channel family protein
VQAIVDLSVRYGIVTPYTSYLITEEDILTEEGRAGAAQKQAATTTAAPSSGEEAVNAAVAAGGMADSDQAAPAPSDDESGDGTGGGVRIVGQRAFVNQDGAWVETTFDPSKMTTIKVQFASDDYFKLLDLRPDLAEAFSLGDRVIALSDGVAFEVTPDEQPPIDFSAL